MKDKYFTPDIEDVYVGYELEWKCKIRNQDWEKTTCDTDLISIIYDEYEHAEVDEPFIEQFRVPYLTMEQIEAEGYNHVGGKLQSAAEQIYEKDYFEIKYTEYNEKLIIQYKNKCRDNSGNFDGYIIKYDGYCKDINTFRKIIKSLKL